MGGAGAPWEASVDHPVNSGKLRGTVIKRRGGCILQSFKRRNDLALQIGKPVKGTLFFGVKSSVGHDRVYARPGAGLQAEFVVQA